MSTLPITVEQIPAISDIQSRMDESAMHREAVKYEHEDEHRHECEPQVVLVGFQNFCQAVVVRQGAAHHEVEFRNVCGRVEICVVRRRASPAEVVPAAVGKRLAHLFAVLVAVHLRVVLVHVVVNNLPVTLDKRHSQPVHVVRPDVLVERLLGVVAHIFQRFGEPRVVVLEACVERTDFVFALACVLEKDESRREQDEY